MLVTRHSHRPVLPLPTMSDPDSIDDLRDYLLDRSSGNGSRSYAVDKNEQDSYSPFDGRYETRTWFKASDVAGSRVDWAKLAKWNDGMMDRGKMAYRATVQRDVDTYADILELSAVEVERVKYIIASMNLGNVVGAKKAEIGILATCTLVRDESLGRTVDVTDDDAVELAMSSRLQAQPIYDEILDSIDATHFDVMKARKAIRNKTDFF